MILRGKLYDGVKIAGKWVLPISLVILPIAQAFVDKGDFSPRAYATVIIAGLMVIANYAQARSKKNYTLEQEAAGVVTVDTNTEGLAGIEVTD